MELKGIGMDFFKYFFSNKFFNWILSDNELWRICIMLNGNLILLKILINVVNEFKFLLESFDCVLLLYFEFLSEEEVFSVFMVF